MTPTELAHLESLVDSLATLSANLLADVTALSSRISTLEHASTSLAINNISALESHISELEGDATNLSNPNFQSIDRRLRLAEAEIMELRLSRP